LNRDPKLVDLIRTRFVPLAVAAHESGRKDGEGAFLKRIAESQDYGKRFGHVQGLLVADAAGEVYFFANTDAGYQDEQLADKLRAAADAVKPVKAVALDEESDQRFRPDMPPGTRVVRVLTRNFDAPGERTRLGSEQLGYENMWIRPDEAQRLAAGEVPESLKRRIAQYHLFNSYTGESQLHHAGKGPDHVEGEAGVRHFELTIDDGELHGSAHIVISPTHYYRATLRGVVEVRDGRLTRFELVARGPAVKKFFDNTPLEQSTQVNAFRMATDEQLEKDGSYAVPPGFHVHRMADYLGLSGSDAAQRQR
jgi:hypothetical protein